MYFLKQELGDSPDTSVGFVIPTAFLLYSGKILNGELRAGFLVTLKIHVPELGQKEG